MVGIISIIISYFQRSNLSSTLVHHFPFIRSLVQAYSPPISKRTPYTNTYSNPPSVNNNNNNNNIPIQRSKSISSSITPDNVLNKHRTLQLSSSFDNTHLSSTFVRTLPNNNIYEW
jgi:hypothetical protein